MQVPGLRLFAVYVSAASVSQPASIPLGSPAAPAEHSALHLSHVPDVVLGLSWSARLQNLLPTDVDLQFSPCSSRGSR